MNRDAVVLEDGRIIYLDEVSTDSIFVLNQTNITFNFNGRLNKFKRNQLVNNDYYMEIYDEVTGKFIGYFPELEFWNSAKPNNTSTDVIPLNSNDARLYRNSYLGSSYTISKETEIKEGTNIIMFYRNMMTSNEVMSYIRKFNFTRNTNAYPNPNQIIVTENKILINNNPITMDDIVTFPGYLEIINSTPIVTKLHNYYLKVSQKCFIQPNGSYDFDNTDYTGFTVLDVTFLLHQLYSNTEFIDYLDINNLKHPFEKHIDIIKDSSFTILPQIVFEENYTLECFSLMRIKLLEFKYWINGVAFKPDNFFEDLLYKPTIEDFIVRIIGVFNSIELSALPYQIKIDFLQKMLEKNLFLTGRWWPFYSKLKLTEEEVVVKLIESIKFKDANGVLNYFYIDDFLNKLNTKPWWILTDSTETLFEFLYNKIHDDVFLGDDGTGARGQFVKAVVNLWSDSSYNPYRVRTDVIEDPEDVALNALNNFIYTSTPAFILSETGVGVELVDEFAAPMLLDYESKRVLLWNINDFSFDFEETKIVVKKELVTGTYINNTGLENETKEFMLYGTYNILQPIALGKLETNQDNDYLIKMPYKSVDGTFLDPQNPTPQFLSNCFPIFYLMYADDVANNSNNKETIGIALDIVLTFTGVGNIPKLRHLRHGANIMAKWLHLGYDSLSLIEKARIAKLGVQVLSVADAFVSSMNILWGFYTSGCGLYHNPSTGQLEPVPQEPSPSDPNYAVLLEAYKKYQFCKTVDTYFFAVEIFILVGNLVSLRALRRAGIKLKKKKPSIGIDLPTSQVIDDLAGNIAEYVDDFLSRIQSDFPNLHGLLSSLHSNNPELATDFILELDELSPDILKLINNLPTIELNDITTLAKLKTAISNAKKLFRSVKFFSLPYIVKDMGNIMSGVIASAKYGPVGRTLFHEVSLFSMAMNIRGKKLKVMICGMVYHSDEYTSPIFKFTNFTDAEIGKLHNGIYYLKSSSGVLPNTVKSPYQLFLEDLDDVLVERMQAYITKRDAGLLRLDNFKSQETMADLIGRAGLIASHGEVRALNALIKHLKNSSNIEFKEELLEKILAYNHSVMKSRPGTMPTCLNCHFLTDLVTFMKP